MNNFICTYIKVKETERLVLAQSWVKVALYQFYYVTVNVHTHAIVHEILLFHFWSDFKKWSCVVLCMPYFVAEASFWKQSQVGQQLQNLKWGVCHLLCY